MVQETTIMVLSFMKRSVLTDWLLSQMVPDEQWKWSKTLNNGMVVQVECLGCYYTSSGQLEHMDYGGCLYDWEECCVCSPAYDSDDNQ